MNARFIGVVLWAVVLFIFTCTTNLQSLLHHQIIGFSFNPDPDFADFVKLTDINKVHHDWYIVKLGHFAGFGIMDALLLYWLRKKNAAFLLAAAFAVATEIFQLYFNRDGRFYDVLIDSCGIFFTYMLIDFPVSRTHRERKSEPSR